MITPPVIRRGLNEPVSLGSSAAGCGVYCSQRVPFAWITVAVPARANRRYQRFSPCSSEVHSAPVCVRSFQHLPLSVPPDLVRTLPLHSIYSDAIISQPEAPSGVAGCLRGSHLGISCHVGGFGYQSPIWNAHLAVRAVAFSGKNMLKFKQVPVYKV